MSIIRNRLYQFKQELLSNKDRAWYSHTNLLTAVDLLILFYLFQNQLRSHSFSQPADMPQCRLSFWLP